MICRNIFRVVFSLLLFVTFSRSASAQSIVFPEWTQRVDVSHFDDAPHAIATDALGNSYVTGTITINTPTGPDKEMMTIKYDSDGRMLWRVFLSSPVQSAHGWDVAVDAKGNVYVLSLVWLSKNSTGDPTEAEFTITKYDSKGVRLWFVFQNTGSNGDALPGKLYVSSDGTVYVSGSLAKLLLTAKYDTNGNRLWASTLGPGFDVPVSTGLGADTSNNVYSSATKYDPNGNLVWSINPQDVFSPFSGPVSKYYADQAGNSYVGVDTDSEDGHFGVFDTNLSFLFGWSAGRFPPFQWKDFTSDSAGTAYAVAAIQGVDANGKPAANPPPFQSSFMLLKINKSITKFAFFNGHADASGTDKPVAVAVNSIGDVYITGTSSNAAKTQTDIVTIKYDRNLNLLWQQRYHGAGSGDDAPIGMKIGGDGGLLLAGTSHGAGTLTDWVTLDYIQDAITAVPTALKYPTQALKTASDPQTVTVTNKSEVTAKILSITLTGDFHQTNTCPLTLAPGSSCVVHIVFEPTAAGTRVGTLTVTDDWEDAPRRVTLSGTSR